MITPEDLDLNRIILHRVHKKRDGESQGFAEYSENIFDFGAHELKTLKDRICTAFSKNKRFFKLEIAQVHEESFFGKAKNLKAANQEEFLEISKEIADLLAISHDRRTIPSGLLLVTDGYYKKDYHFTLVIKAELQEAFTIKEIDQKKLVELINDLFLSPAKDFYKIGYLVQERNSGRYPNDEFSAYMYDDNFKSGKNDLAEYFYDKFLGFTTSKNDKLLTKNFYNDIYDFIETNVKNFEDRKGLKKAVMTLYRENTTGVINPQEFADLHFDEPLLKKFNSQLTLKYPHSFTKDLSLLDKKLLRGKISLMEDLRIEGPTDSLEQVDVLNGKNVNMDLLKMRVENGDFEQIITIRTNKSFE